MNNNQKPEKTPEKKDGDDSDPTDEFVEKVVKLLVLFTGFLVARWLSDWAVGNTDTAEY